MVGHITLFHFVPAHLGASRSRTSKPCGRLQGMSLEKPSLVAFPAELDPPNYISVGLNIYSFFLLPLEKAWLVNHWV